MKTVKVRITVAVGPNGSWSACGDTSDDGWCKESAIDGLAIHEDGYRIAYVTAEVPVPEAIEVEGEVE